MKKYYFIFLIPWVLAVNVAKGQDVGEERFTREESRQICIDNMVTIWKYQNLCNNTTWKLVFEDNFDGNTLDLSKWFHWTGVPRDPTFNSQKAWHKAENSVVENGLLKIISKREQETHWWNGEYVDFDYTSGEIWTNLKFIHGKLEALIKIPKGWGFAPAFWMFGNPPWNEIDVFEFSNERENLSKIHCMNVHYGNKDKTCSSNYIGPDFSEDFHVFTMTWDENCIRWYVDGALKKKLSRYYTAVGLIPVPGIEVDCDLYPGMYVQQPFPRDPMNIVLNVAILNGSNEPDRTTPFPSQMEVDYVKFYQRLPCYSESTLITNPATLNMKDGCFNSVVGTTIKMGNGFTLENEQHLSARASDKIVLQDGFTAKAGCNFTAKIDPSACSSSKGPEDEINEDDFFTQGEGADIIPKRIGLEEDIMSNIYVYPNPAQDKLFIEIPYYEQTVRYKIQLLNAQGKILQRFVTGQSVSMDMNNYPQGLYLLNIINTETGEVINFKIIKR